VTTKKISIDIPREVLHAAKMSTKELKQELAITLYEKGKLSFGKAREIAEMKVGAFQQLLGSRDIPVNYDVESYEEDLETLKEMGQL
jgi:predicted HTH domain antitoxin